VIRSTTYEEIHPRINQSLESLDKIMALGAIEMNENTHHSFLKACQRAHKL